uniref:(northern house mosquito) hypothetical protein n=1 Tax=Culex pipiens TaxID=7175 RepID=A0A8D8BXP7_CULPI
MRPTTSSTTKNWAITAKRHTRRFPMAAKRHQRRVPMAVQRPTTPRASPATQDPSPQQAPRHPLTQTPHETAVARPISPHGLPQAVKQWIQLLMSAARIALDIPV